ncbi:MAG: SRPBCC domain-containing protein [Streptosporangiaceae bacterium]
MPDAEPHGGQGCLHRHAVEQVVPVRQLDRYVHTDAHGNTYGFHGVFHGDPSPQAIVQTFEFEGAPGHVALQTATFSDRGGSTLVRTVSAFQSVEDRDAMVASGMERGARDSGERLAELLAKLQSN